MTHADLWSRYKAHLYTNESLGLAVDLSRMSFDDAWMASMTPRVTAAFEAMRALEAGAIANPDEKRMVGHYWLRHAALAPTEALRVAIDDTLANIKRFAAQVHEGTLANPQGQRFQNVLVVGIGGSALGPQFVANALGGANDRMRVFFIDNTDPDGIDRTLHNLQRAGGLGATLTVVISKSGGTKETRNGMLEVERAYTRDGRDFARHAVAVTGDGSELDAYAKKHGWLTTFPMWDWVGGRTSELSAVGLLPAALQGVDIDGMLQGAREMDAATRVEDVRNNPAALMALMWFRAGDGRGAKDMVVLPYKDRLELFSRYLQQLVMESLGKEHDLSGAVVEQGIAVYGNKGSTDQHAYVQQLRDGVPNFFATFIEVLRDRDGESLAVEPGVTAGDFLFGFLEGTRKALHDKGRGSITVTVRDASAHTVGMLIALYERTVGLYASIVNINAYHQPGVEAGKKAATRVIALQAKVVAEARKHATHVSADDIARAIGEDDVETVYKILRHVSANPDHGVRGVHTLDPTRARFGG